MVRKLMQSMMKRMMGKQAPKSILSTPKAAEGAPTKIKPAANASTKIKPAANASTKIKPAASAPAREGGYYGKPRNGGAQPITKKARFTYGSRKVN
jgi:hypothetical protein